MATAAIAAGVNGTKKNTGSASALCTAKPTAGANGKASRAGTRRRVSAKPRPVQNSVATAAQKNGAGDRCHRGKLCCRPNRIECRDYRVSTEIRASPGGPHRPCLRQRRDEGERGRGAVALALLEIALDAAELVRDMGEADHRPAAGRSERVERGRLHLDGKDAGGAAQRDGRGRLAERRVGRPGRADMGRVAGARERVAGEARRGPGRHPHRSRAEGSDSSCPRRASRARPGCNRAAARLR